MNAKKIMGAVLVALLAAALFVGAGAAVSSGDTVFVYEKTTETGTIAFTNEDGKTILMVDGVISGEGIVEGIYTQVGGSGVKINVMYPDAKISAETTGTAMPILGGNVADNAVVKFSATSYSKNVQAFDIVFTSPEGVVTKMPNGKDPVTNNGNYDLTGIMAGEWKVQVMFTDDLTVLNTPQAFSKTIYTFTVIDTNPAISLSADEVITGNTFFVTVTGEPGASVKLTSVDENAQFVKPVAGQVEVKGADLFSGITFTLPESGKKEVALFGDGIDGKFTINAAVTYSAGTENVKAKVNIAAGEITAVADAEFYYLGTKVVISGTNTESKDVYFYIKGNNVDFQQLMDGTKQVSAKVGSDKTFKAEIEGYVFDNFDAGTYTIYAVSEEIHNLVNIYDSNGNVAQQYYAYVDLSECTYAPVSVVLKQPFLTAELSASVVAQDSKLTISGTAEAAENVMFYVFGNNKFASGKLAVDDDGTFEKEITINANEFATGQYFVVIQHPMYNGIFNIGPLYYNQTSGLYELTAEDPAAITVGNKGKAEIVLNTTASYDSVKPAPKANVLFNTLERQSSNAAEALCQALDTQNIDDLYVKATFVVAQPTATINPVDDVAKGAKLVVSGTSNMAPGTLVTVEMLSTAFAAIPKESVNSASFITLTTKVQEDGTWEVEFDTTGLNVDEYTIGATVDSIKTPTVVVKVLESAPVTPEQPDTPVTPEQPEQPEQPTEPETPGFGALAALAGLGAVAVLLLRRE